jgi:repressor of nif and glnA expression
MIRNYQLFLNNPSTKIMSNSRQTEKKVNANIDHFSAEAQEEVTRLRKEIDDLRIRARPKVQEAENFLTSPQVTGFIGGKLCVSKVVSTNSFFNTFVIGFVAATAIVLGYAKYNGGIRL